MFVLDGQQSTPTMMQMAVAVAVQALQMTTVVHKNIL
jgi:hypothetical protein